MKTCNKKLIFVVWLLLQNFFIQGADSSGTENINQDKIMIVLPFDFLRKHIDTSPLDSLSQQSKQSYMQIIENYLRSTRFIDLMVLYIISVTITPA